MKKFNLNAAVRKYTDNSGQEKTQWQTIGRLIVNDDNLAAYLAQNLKSMFIAIDAIPVSKEWSGNVGIYEPLPPLGQQQAQQPQQQYQQPMPQPQYQQPMPQPQYQQQYQQQPVQQQPKNDLPF